MPFLLLGKFQAIAIALQKGKKKRMNDMYRLLSELLSIKRKGRKHKLLSLLGVGTAPYTAIRSDPMGILDSRNRSKLWWRVGSSPVAVERRRTTKKREKLQ